MASKQTICVHGIHVTVATEGGAALESLLASLHAFPHLARRASGGWRLTLSVGSVRQAPVERSPWVAHTRVKVFPDTVLDYRLAEDRAVLLEKNAAWALVEPSLKRAQIRVDSVSPDNCRLAGVALSELLRYEGFYTIHAAALEYRGGAVLVCAPSGGGKSTLSAVWAASGRARFMADDLCLLQRRNGVLCAAGIATPIMLSERSREFLAHQGVRFAHQSNPGAEKTGYDCRTLFGEICQELLPVRAVLLPSAELSPGDAPVPCPLPMASHQMLGSGLHWGDTQVLRGHFEALLDVLQQAAPLRTPARPRYPQVLDELDRMIETRQMSAVPQRDRRAAPNIPRSRMAIAARRCCRMAAGDLSEGVGADEHGWRDLIKAAERHGLLPLLGARMVEAGLLAQLPAGLQSVVRSSLERAEASRLLHLSVLGEVKSVLDAPAIPWCVIKGPSIAERFYPSAPSRPYGDLDIVISARDRSRAEAALAAIGFRTSPLNLRLKCPQSRGESVLVRYMPAHYVVELHWDYITGGSLRKRVRCELSPVLGRGVGHIVQGTVFPMPTLADQLVGSCIHAAFGHQWDCLLHLADIAMMAQAARDADLDQIGAESRRLGLRNAISLSVWRAATFFPSPAIQRVSACLRGDPVAGWLAARVMPPWASVCPWTKTNRIRRSLFRGMLKLGVL